MRESSVASIANNNANNAGFIMLTTFETQINQTDNNNYFNNNHHNRSLSFDDASSVCTNSTDYTNDSLSSSCHLFSTLKQTDDITTNTTSRKAQRNRIITSCPSLHRCDANDEDSIIASTDNNNNNTSSLSSSNVLLASLNNDSTTVNVNLSSSLLQSQSQCEVVDFCKQGVTNNNDFIHSVDDNNNNHINNAKLNYNEAFMNANVVLADVLITVDDTIDDAIEVDN